MIFRRQTPQTPVQAQAVVPPPDSYPAWVAYEPKLVPPAQLMGAEGITVLEEWFRWAEEWSLLLRHHGRLTPTSRVLEIGCGLGRIAFPLRYLLGPAATYTGFEIVREKIEFLAREFHTAHPNFTFVWADVANTYYNPLGRYLPTEYRFPVADASCDLVYAASVFTHMAPENAQHYVREAARVVRPGGRVVLSAFLLDNYRSGAPRPSAFQRGDFAFEYREAEWGDDFAYSVPNNREQMTAFSRAFFERVGAAAGLTLAHTETGFWSGRAECWISTQDLIVYERS